MGTTLPQDYNPTFMLSLGHQQASMGDSWVSPPPSKKALLGGYFSRAA